MIILTIIQASSELKEATGRFEWFFLRYLLTWVKGKGLTITPPGRRSLYERGKREIQLKGGVSVSPTTMLRYWVMGSSRVGHAGVEIEWFGNGMRS